MSFWNSLKNQVGRDTGRRISNWLFGMKHYHPHRFEGKISKEYKNSEESSSGSSYTSTNIDKTVTENVTVTEDKTEIARIQAEKFKARMDMAYEFFGFEDTKTKAEKKEVLENARNINLGTTKDEIVDTLSKVTTLANSTPQGELFPNSKQTGGIEQAIKNICIEKLDFGIMKLASMGALSEANFFQQKLEILVRQRGKRRLLKTAIISAIILVFVGLYSYYFWWLNNK